MMRFFKPSAEIVKQEVQQPEKKSSGFFGRNDIAERSSNYSKTMRMQSAIARVFQKTSADLVAVDATGEALTGVAMDSGELTTKQITQNAGYIPLQQLEWFAGQSFIGWSMCSILAQNWLIDKACTMPAKDAVRHGWDIEVNDGTRIDPLIFDEMRAWDKKFKVKQHCIEFARSARIFGIRHALFIVESPDPNYYEKPFDPDGIRPGSYKGISQIDPYWISPELDSAAAANPISTHFYEPTWWRINGKRIHRSHFVIMRAGGELPDLLKPTYMYGGIPLPQKIFERVYAAEKTANEAPMLAMSKRLTVLKVDTTQAIANSEDFRAKMEEWSALMNSFGVKVIGGEEEIEQFDTNLGGFDETVATQYQLVAAIAEVPSTKLLGTSPKGFNATGEYEETSYHEMLESMQENDLSALVERHHMLVIRSFISPKHAIPPFNSEVNWLPVDSPTAIEVAELNNKNADTDSKLATLGAIDGFDVRQRIIKGRDTGYSGIPDIVDGGPGDREAEREAEALEAQALLEPTGADDTATDEFKESDHPRDKAGRFAETDFNKGVYYAKADTSRKEGTLDFLKRKISEREALGMATPNSLQKEYDDLKTEIEKLQAKNGKAFRKKLPKTIKKKNRNYGEDVEKIADAINKLGKGVVFAHVDTSGISESTYLTIEIDDEITSDAVKIRISDHEDKHGGNNYNLSVSDGDPSDLYKIIDDVLKEFGVVNHAEIFPVNEKK